LIYFGPDIQHDVIPIFHYSLRPSGHLLLGTSENITQFPELFVPVDKKNRIFRARDDVPTSHPAVLFNSSKVQRHNEWAAGAESRASSVARHEIESQVLERLAPAHVVVNNDGEVIHYSAKTGKYFEPPVGAPTRQLIAIARKGLRLDLRTAVRDCIQSGTKCIRQHVHLDTDDGRKQLVTISVEPIPSRNRDNPLLLVSFLDEGQPETAEQTEARFAKTSGEEGAAQLERELHETRDRLQSQIEEYESALEELKSSNEELVSLNEEMQSTNEELEASKEEMQSLNEELHTVNLELTAKVDALDRANNDLKNLLASTEIATVFLDAALNIRMFTPGISRIFNILPSDRGRPLTHITSRFPMPGLAKDVSHVLSSGDRLERAAKDEAGAHLLIRLNPYHNSDSIIDGVVVSFIELSERP